MEEVYENNIPCARGCVMGVRIRKGDTVEVISGRERGKRGKVIRVLSADNSVNVLVERLNIIKKHMKPSPKIKEGGILEMEGPINISNVSMVCPKCDKITRIGFKVSDDKAVLALSEAKNVRYCKKCKEIID